jgi:cell shape-determining protein MreC
MINELIQYNNLTEKNILLKKELELLQKRESELESWLKKIYNAKSYKYWQQFNNFKKFLFSKFLFKVQLFSKKSK